MTLITDAVAYNAGRDELSYPPIPHLTKEFLTQKLGYEEPTEFHGWEWSTTFGKWSALVTLENGWHGFTYPKPCPQAHLTGNGCAVCGA